MAAVVQDLLRRQPGVDVIALLAKSAALALRQTLAGAVVALMLSGGLALAAYSDGRARRDLSALGAWARRSAAGAGVFRWSRCRSNRSGVATSCWLALAKSSR